MRNRWGIELKKGYHAWGAWGNRQHPVDGTIVAIDRTSDYARAYGAQVTINFNGDEITIPADSINQVLPPMRVGRGGVVRANPLQRVRVNSPSMATGEAPSKRLVKRRKKTNKAPDGFYANPLTRVRLKSPSMATGEEPSKRLLKRRRKTAKAPEGFYANPLDPRVKFGDALRDTAGPDAMRDFGEYYFVQWKREGDRQWGTQKIFETYAEAEKYARAWHRRAPDIYIRVVLKSPATGNFRR